MSPQVLQSLTQREPVRRSCLLVVRVEREERHGSPRCRLDALEILSYQECPCLCQREGSDVGRPLLQVLLVVCRPTPGQKQHPVAAPLHSDTVLGAPRQLELERAPRQFGRLVCHPSARHECRRDDVEILRTVSVLGRPLPPGRLDLARELQPFQGNQLQAHYPRAPLRDRVAIKELVGHLQPRLVVPFHTNPVDLFFDELAPELAVRIQRGQSVARRLPRILPDYRK